MIQEPDVKKVLPKDKEAFVILYDRDLSSLPQGYTKLTDELINKINQAWLAIVVYKEDSNRCIMAVVSNGEIIHEDTFKGYVYRDPNSILTRSTKGVEGLCI